MLLSRKCPVVRKEQATSHITLHLGFVKFSRIRHSKCFVIWSCIFFWSSIEWQPTRNNRLFFSLFYIPNVLKLIFTFVIKLPNFVKNPTINLLLNGIHYGKGKWTSVLVNGGDEGTAQHSTAEHSDYLDRFTRSPCRLQVCNVPSLWVILSRSEA